jgi:hypothetical protein
VNYGVWQSSAILTVSFVTSTDEQVVFGADEMRRKTPSEVLKAAIKIDGRPVHRIAKDAGVDHAAVSRFVNGRRGITVLTFDRLAATVNLQVIHRKSA